MYFINVCYIFGRFLFKETLVMPLVLLYLLKQLYQKQTVLRCSPVLQDGAEMSCLKLTRTERASGSIPHTSSHPLSFPCRAPQVNC